MIIQQDKIPLLDYKNGDQVTASAINTHAIRVYTKFNNLNAYNVNAINTGHFYDDTNSISYVNYCGWLMRKNVGVALIYDGDINGLIDDLIDDINDIIKLNIGN